MPRATPRAWRQAWRGNVAAQSGQHRVRPGRLRAGGRAVWIEPGAYREVGDDAGAALALNNLGTALREAGQPDEAVTLHEESLALRRAWAIVWVSAQALDNLGRVALQRGDLKRAGPLLRESLVLWRELGDHLSPPRTIEDLASLAAAEGDAERAVRLWGAADALRTRMSFPIAFRRRQRHTADLEAARSRLGEARFDTAGPTVKRWTWTRRSPRPCRSTSSAAAAGALLGRQRASKSSSAPANVKWLR